MRPGPYWKKSIAQRARDHITQLGRHRGREIMDERDAEVAGEPDYTETEEDMREARPDDGFSGEDKYLMQLGMHPQPELDLGGKLYNERAENIREFWFRERSIKLSDSAWIEIAARVEAGELPHEILPEYIGDPGYDVEDDSEVLDDLGEFDDEEFYDEDDDDWDD